MDAVPCPSRFVVTLAVRPAEAVSCVRISGDIDLVDETVRAVAIEKLTPAVAQTVMVDLDDSSFMGSALVGFLVRILHAAPAGSSLVLCRPPRRARWVISATSLRLLAALRDDLPPEWVTPTRELVAVPLAG